MAFVRGFNPIWSFVDLVGEQCDDTCYLWVLENQIPYAPSTVYHDLNGTLPWTFPIQLLANGTLPVDVYWDDTKVYRLELRRNLGLLPPSQADELIYEVNNYIPDGSSSITPGGSGTSQTDNQITNPQFSIINFDSPYTLAATNPPPIEVAPGWFLDLAGTGVLTLRRESLDNASANATNAPYALHITLTGGWTGVPVLRQRLQQNGMLWANKYVSTSITARSVSGAPNITARLDASDGTPLAVLLNTPITTSFVEYKGVNLLPATTNPNDPPNAYIDFKLLLPTVVDLYLTSFQLVSSETTQTLTYEQDTINRQIDHMFNYFKPKLEYKPIPSYLTAWDFFTNPAQFGEVVPIQATGNNKSFYAWDQTIVFQSVTNAVDVLRDTNGGIRLHINADTTLAVIQYLGEAQARELLQGNLSVALRGSSNLLSSGYVTLWATDDATLPDLKPANYNSIVATLDVDGTVLTTNGPGWVQLNKTGGPATFAMTAGDNEFYFNGWSDNLTTPLKSTATYFAIVVSFATETAGDHINLDWVSLCAGDIATKPAPQTEDQVLRECQRYYEMSYETAEDIDQPNIFTNSLAYPQNSTQISAGASSCQPNGFPVIFNTIKRVTNPTVTLYSPVNTTGGGFVNMKFVAQANGSNDLAAATWSATLGNKICHYETTVDVSGTAKTISAPNTPAVFTVRFHYTADARFGIVL
jgi:hypothetical protein